VACRVLFTR